MRLSRNAQKVDGHLNNRNLYKREIPRKEQSVSLRKKNNNIAPHGKPPKTLNSVSTDSPSWYMIRNQLRSTTFKVAAERLRSLKTNVRT